MKQLLFPLICILLLSACENNSYKFPQADIQFNKTDLEINRYGKTLFELDTSNFQHELEKIQDQYRVFLDADLNDTANVNQLLDYVSDTQLISIYHKTVEVYPNLEHVEKSLSDAIGRHNYLFPGKSIPKAYTYISDLYFEQPVWKNDTTLIIALDVYLGADFYLYKKLGLPYYKVRCMTPDNLVVDVMKAYYFVDVVQQFKKRTLLDHMIEGGKLLTYLDAVLPYVPDSVKICYSAKKLKWAKDNEKIVWAFLIENNVLYSTDYQTQTKLIQDGPFTTAFSNDSPSRLGIYLGWNIVNRFMNNNPEVSLNEMLSITDSQTILQKSGYKP